MIDSIVTLFSEYWVVLEYRILGSLIAIGLGSVGLTIAGLSIQTFRRNRRQDQRDELMETFAQLCESTDPDFESWSDGYSRKVTRDVLVELGQGDQREVAHRAWHDLGFARQEQEALKKGRTARRLRAIRRLYVFGDENDLQPVVEALDEVEDRRFRVVAAQLLAKQDRGEDVVRALEGVTIGRRTMEQPFYSAFRLLSKEQLSVVVDGKLEALEPRLRRVLLDVAAQRGIEAVVDRIESMATSDDLEQRIGAVQVATALGGKTGRTIAVELLNDSAWQVRAQAARGLGKIGSRQEIPVLTKAIDDSDFWVRENAGVALEMLDPGGGLRLEVMETANEYAGDDTTREVAASAVAAEPG